MPKKQNGFGSTKSFTAKGFNDVNNRTDRGIGPKAAGSYPSDRRYGTSVQRTIIERYDLESEWIRWRTGYEYYAQATFEELRTYNQITQEYQNTSLKSKLYQGTPYEVDVTFTGQRYPTKNSDSNNHYVVKRTTTSVCELFKITEVYGDPLADLKGKENQELWTQGSLGPDGKLLLHMIGERLTDGESEATLTYILNEDQRPALFIGKTLPEGQASVKVTVPLSEFDGNQFIADHGGDIRSLIGEIAYVRDFFVEKDIALVDDIEFIDEPYFFEVAVVDNVPDQEFKILEKTTDLAPSIYDIDELEDIFKTDDADYTIAGTYTYQKELYQRFYGNQYLTADLVKESIKEVSYTVLPFVINDLLIVGDQVIFSSVPFIGELNLYALSADNNYLVFADYSFIQKSLDTYNGEYKHPVIGPYNDVYEQIAGTTEFSDLVWYKIINDIDPWTQQVFTNPDTFLKPAVVYSCSCPSYSNAIIRTPQTREDEGRRKVNRQRNYPLPTAQGRGDYNSIGLDSAAGIMQSWENRKDRMSYKCCKHSICSMFHDHLKLQEPSTYQTVIAREQFEAKLKKDVATTKADFIQSYERGGISTLEIVFALAQGLNLDEVETAFVVLNSGF